MEEINYDNLIHTGMNGRQKCSVCKRAIPADVKRISFSAPGMYGSTKYTRVCAECLIELAKLI